MAQGCKRCPGKAGRSLIIGCGHLFRPRPKANLNTSFWTRSDSFWTQSDMSLRLTLSAVAGGFLRAMTEGERPMERAATAAVREAAEMAKSAGRANIATAGFSRKWQNALRARIFPPNHDRMRALRGPRRTARGEAADRAFAARIASVVEFVSGRRGFVAVTSGCLQIQGLCFFVLEQILDLPALSFVRMTLSSLT